MSGSAKKIYIKDESFDPIYKTVSKPFLFKSRVVPGLLLGLGFVILTTQVAYPLVYFKTHNETEKPLTKSVLGVATGFSEFEFSELDRSETSVGGPVQIPEYFKISIPKLKIDSAEVETNSPTLNPEKSLGHYNKSGLPGIPGNTFIYGHSVLPWFYNPKNYKTIFSTLETLSTGDEIIIDYNNQKYVYKVEGKEILAPDKINPLATYKPAYLNESTVTLMTCWPSGTRAKRLIVRAVLEK